MTDVIVVGAGPAGCTAAKTLAERGYRVLLVEKFALPRYKSCSGMLIRKSLDLVKQYFGESVPESVMCLPTENKGMIFTDDKGKEYRFEQDGKNVWRSSFDYWLAEKAKGGGAEVRDAVTAVSIEEKAESVVVSLQSGKRCTEEAAYVIDCEGVVGALKRKLFQPVPEYITTFQTFHEGNIDLDPHYFYAYLQPELSEYDAWFNVKDNLLVLGVSVQDSGNLPEYYERFLSYMEKQHHLKLGRQIKADKWLMPRIGPGCPVNLGKNRILLAGETAGFLNPMGEGISAGLESGYAAGNAVAEHFDDADAVRADYRKRTEQLCAYMKRQWSFVGRMADTFREMRL